jgi:regulator of sigma E protease
MVVAILAIILTLILVIGIHEAGHALVAYLFKIKIKRIAIGFGRPLLRWRSKSGCEWVLGLWFLGGYVQLYNTRISPVKPEEYSSCFDKKPIWQRVLVLGAGVAANMIMAWLAFIFVFYAGILYKMPEIQSVEPNSLAAQAGLQPQEQFVSIAGYETSSWQDVGRELIIAWGSPNILVSMKTKDGEIKQQVLDLSHIQFTPAHHSLLTGLGITPNPRSTIQKIQASSFFAAITEANKTIGHLFYFFTMVLKQLFTGTIPFSALLGPVGLFAASITSLTQGVAVFFYFIANLSVAVALINIAPIPGLDGGAIVYALLEKIRGEPISVALEILIYRLMLIIVFLLLVQLLKNDMVHFFIRS